MKFALKISAVFVFLFCFYLNTHTVHAESAPTGVRVQSLDKAFSVHKAAALERANRRFVQAEETKKCIEKAQSDQDLAKCQPIHPRIGREKWDALREKEKAAISK